MDKERDVRLVRFDLRLRVGTDGDPLDNELHDAWSRLPENTVIRNDWLRRRLLLGHILEREGLTQLFSAIGQLGVAPQSATPQAGAPTAPPQAPAFTGGPTAVADFLPPVAEPEPAPAPVKPSARNQLGGLLPAIPVVAEQGKPDNGAGQAAAEKEAPAKEAPAQAGAKAEKPAPAEERPAAARKKPRLAGDG